MSGEERAAREGRAETWLNEQAIPLEWPYYTNRKYHTLKLAVTLTAYAESECSRLARRVERLEKALKFYGKHRANCVLKTFMLANDPDCTCGLKTVLAGAHAEEKK